ncbi:MAG: hypothetical protein ACFFCW_14760 [Candidatus Hodarchaeota archaeon]
MELPVGKIEYEMGSSPVACVGLSYTAEELDAALGGPVAAIVFDDKGTADLSAILQTVTDTDFDKQEVERILVDEIKPKIWEVGEALAETYLTHHYDCHFPWPDGRDIRKPKSSLPGADMVGFHTGSDALRFAFGEVKTSKESSYPPQVVTYGDHALNKQLCDIRDKISLRDQLIKYLGHRAKDAEWKDSFKNATENYIKSKGSAVSIFGILIRDVTPNKADVEGSHHLLSDNCPTQTIIQLLAVYLPSDSIDMLSEKIMRSREGGDA